MENLAYDLRPLPCPAFPRSLYETFSPLAWRFACLQGAPMYCPPPDSLSISQNTEALSSVYSFPEPSAYTR